MLKKLLTHGRILGLLAVILFAAVSCEDTYSPDSPDSNIETAAMKAAAVGGNYTVDAATTDGFTFTLTIDQSAAQDISHLIVQLVDCGGEFVTIDNFLSASVNGIDWPLTATTGSGTGCEFENDFVKFDDFDFDGGVVVVEFTLDVQSAGGNFLIKAGQGCFEYGIEGYCVVDEKCYDFNGETAWAAGSRYVNRGNWATYTPFVANSTVTLFAGQKLNAGTVSFSGIVDGYVTISISLTGAWEFDAVSENVKIQDYSVVPSGNPSPGGFAHKGDASGKAFSITVPANNFYGVHIDLGYWFEVECPEDEVDPVF